MKDFAEKFLKAMEDLRNCQSLSGLEAIEASVKSDEEKEVLSIFRKIYDKAYDLGYDRGAEETTINYEENMI